MNDLFAQGKGLYREFQVVFCSAKLTDIEKHEESQYHQQLLDIGKRIYSTFTVQRKLSGTYTIDYYDEHWFANFLAWVVCGTEASQHNQASVRSAFADTIARQVKMGTTNRSVVTNLSVYSVVQGLVLFHDADNLDQVWKIARSLHGTLGSFLEMLNLLYAPSLLVKNGTVRTVGSARANDILACTTKLSNYDGYLSTTTPANAKKVVGALMIAHFTVKNVNQTVDLIVDFLSSTTNIADGSSVSVDCISAREHTALQDAKVAVQQIVPTPTSDSTSPTITTRVTPSIASPTTSTIPIPLLTTSTPFTTSNSTATITCTTTATTTTTTTTSTTSNTSPPLTSSSFSFADANVSLHLSFLSLRDDDGNVYEVVRCPVQECALHDQLLKNLPNNRRSLSLHVINLHHRSCSAKNLLHTPVCGKDRTAQCRAKTKTKRGKEEEGDSDTPDKAQRKK